MDTSERLRSRRPVATAFAAGGLLWGYGSVVLADAAGWEPLLAPASVVLLLAAFGWLRRGREITDVIAQALGVAYAAYLGLALARLCEPGIADGWIIAPFVTPLPAVLLAGVPFALIFAVFVALPVALIRPRGAFGRAANPRFWAIVAEENAARAGARPSQAKPSR